MDLIDFQDFDPDAFADAVIKRTLSISASPSAHEIAVRLAKQIVEGEIPSGHELNSVRLAAEFGTSRSPVREALSALAHAGLVQVPPRKRSKVRSFSFPEAQEIYEMRSMLYAQSAEYFSQNHTDIDLTLLKRIHDLLGVAADARNIKDSLWLNVAFREVEFIGARHALLREMHDLISMRAMILRRTGLTADRLHRSWEDHGRVIIAYEEGDVASAKATSQNIVRRGLQSLKATGL